MWLAFSIGLAGGYGDGRPLSLAIEGKLPLGRARSELSGTVNAEAIARRRPLRGSLRLGRALAYDLSFTGDDGRNWRLVAEQHLTTAGKPSAFTVARGSLDDGSVRHRIELRFDPRSDLRRLLASLALRRE